MIADRMRINWIEDSVSIIVNPVRQIIVHRGSEILETRNIKSTVEMWAYIGKEKPFNRFGRDVVVDVVRQRGNLYRQFYFEGQSIEGIKNNLLNVEQYKADSMIF